MLYSIYMASLRMLIVDLTSEKYLKGRKSFSKIVLDRKVNKQIGWIKREVERRYLQGN